MPVLSRFYGIIIFMNSHDHDPPHFHARYEDQEVIIEILSGIIKEYKAKWALRLIFEWSEIHYEELLDNWHLARERRPLRSISPLP
jgi:hypothetical protein